MVANLSIPTKIINKIALRVMIFIFMYLTWSFAEFFISTAITTHIKLTLIAVVFFEATILIIFDLLFGNDSIGRDINTLNFYGLILHLLYVAGYFLGLQVAEFHNYSIMGLLFIGFLRFFYLGDAEVFYRVSILEKGKSWLENSNFFKHGAINRLTITLFILCALPLFAIIYVVNTDRMTITGIAAVLFTFFIALSRKTNLSALHENVSCEAPKETDADVETLVKAFNARSAANKALILELVTSSFSREDNPITRRHNEVMETYDKRYYFPIGRLMQLLPGDITNQSTLTPEQAEMCLAVSRFSEKAKSIIEEGIITIEQLQFMAMESLLEGPIPDGVCQASCRVTPKKSHMLSGCLAAGIVAAGDGPAKRSYMPPFCTGVRPERATSPSLGSNRPGFYAHKSNLSCRIR